MKKILCFIFVAVAMLGMSACSDDDVVNPYAHDAAISVDSTNVVFQASPSQGFVVVNAPGGITKVASSAPSWCTATASDNTVNISVTQNDNLEARASQITIWSGSDSTQVTVQQMGFVFQLETGTGTNTLAMTDDAHKQSFFLKHNTEITTSASVSWLTAEVDGDSLKLTAKENATGLPRQGYVYYSSGSMKDSVLVSQFEIEKDILGEYQFSYYDDDWTYLPVEIFAKDDGSYAMRFTEGKYAKRGYQIPVTLDRIQPRISINNFDSVGVSTYKHKHYQVVAMVMAYKGNKVYRFENTDIQAVADFTTYDDGYVSYVFRTENLSPEYEFYGLRLGRTSDGTYDGYKNSVVTFPYLELVPD